MCVKELAHGSSCMVQVQTMRILIGKFSDRKLILSWASQHTSSFCHEFCRGRQYLFAA